MRSSQPLSFERETFSAVSYDSRHGERWLFGRAGWIPIVKGRNTRVTSIQISDNAYTLIEARARKWGDNYLRISTFDDKA